MKFYRYQLAAVMVAALVGCAATTAHKSLAAGTLQKGSLANQKLSQDAMVGVSAKAGMLGCTRIDSYEPYVLAMPTGVVGSRTWTERWIVSCQGKEHPISIDFREAGLSAANYTIK
jgi:hypothetical protein